MAKKKNVSEKVTSPAKKANHSSKYRPTTLSAPCDEHWVMMLPVIVFGAVVYMLARFRYYYLPMSQFSWQSYSDDTQLSDFFTRVKAEWILACAAVAVALAVGKYFFSTFELKKTKLYIPIGVYSLFVLLSFAFSDYKAIALRGFHEQHEGTFVLLAYMVMLCYILNVVRGEKNVKQIIYAVAITSGLLCILGLGQLVGKDFFMTVVGQKSLVPNVMLESGYTFYQSIDMAAANGEHVIEFNNYSGTLYQTLFNSNYVAFYLSLLIPIFTMLLLRAMDKNSKEPIWMKLALCVLVGLQIVNCLGSKSAGGIIGLAVSTVFAVVVLNKRLIKMLKPMLVIIIVFAVGLAATSLTWLPEMKNSLKEAFSKEAYINPISFDYIENDGYDVNLSLNGNPLTISYNDADGSVVALDESGAELMMYLQEDGRTLTFDDERFASVLTVSLRVNEEGYLQLKLNIGEKTFTFLGGEDGFYYLTKFGRVDKLKKVEHFGFENNPNFGTNRGYIWSRSFPMLKKNLFVGSGANTFVAEFPQNDIAGRFTTNIYTDGMIIDKPHNLFLNIALNTGCISLIALLIVFGAYIVDSVRLLWKREFGCDFLTYLAAGLLFGVVSFLFAGMTNDCSVSTMPVFYTMLGVGFAVNDIIKRRDSAQADKQN